MSYVYNVSSVERVSRNASATYVCCMCRVLMLRHLIIMPRVFIRGIMFRRFIMLLIFRLFILGIRFRVFRMCSVCRSVRIRVSYRDYEVYVLRCIRLLVFRMCRRFIMFHMFRVCRMCNVLLPFRIVIRFRVCIQFLMLLYWCISCLRFLRFTMRLLFRVVVLWLLSFVISSVVYVSYNSYMLSVFLCIW